MVIKVNGVALLAILFISATAMAGIKSPIKVVSLIDFRGDNQELMVRDTESQCDYHVAVTKSEKNIEWLGVTQPQSRWEFVVDRRKCGDIIERVNMQIVPDTKIKTLPIEAGSVYYIYPDWDAFSQK